MSSAHLVTRRRVAAVAVLALAAAPLVPAAASAAAPATAAGAPAAASSAVTPFAASARTHAAAAGVRQAALAARAPMATVRAVAPGPKSVELWAEAGVLTLPGGASLPIWGFGASAGAPTVPGPQIDVTAGDTVTLTVHNLLPTTADNTNALAVELPGQVTMALDPTTHEAVGAAPSGSDVTVEFSPADPGTFVYQAGGTAGAGRQVTMGLAGLLVVHPQSDPDPGTQAAAADNAQAIAAAQNALFAATQQLAADQALLTQAELDLATAKQNLADAEAAASADLTQLQADVAAAQDAVNVAQQGQADATTAQAAATQAVADAEAAVAAADPNDQAAVDAAAAQLATANAALATANADLQTANDNLTAANEALTAATDAYNLAVQAQTDAAALLTDLQAAVDAAQQTVDALTATVGADQQAVVDAQATLLAAQGQSGGGAQQAVFDAQNALDAANATLTTDQALLMQAQDQLAADQALLAAAQAAASADLTQLQADVAAAQDAVNVAQQGQADATTAQAAATQAVADAEAAVAAADPNDQAAVDAAAAQLATANAALATANADLQTANDNLTAANEALTAATDAYNLAVQAQTDAGASVQALTEAVTADQVQIDTLTPQVAADQAAVQTAQLNLTAAQAALATVPRASAYGPGTEFDQERTVVINEFDPAFNADPFTKDTRGTRSSVFLVNGIAFDPAQPDLGALTAIPGQALLIRYANLGILDRSLVLAGVAQQQVGMDGHETPDHQGISAVYVAPGQTVDTLVPIVPPEQSGRSTTVSEGGMHLMGGPLGGAMAMLDVQQVNLLGGVNKGPVVSDLVLSTGTADTVPTVRDLAAPAALTADATLTARLVGGTQHTLQAFRVSIDGGAPISGTPDPTGTSAAVTISVTGADLAAALVGSLAGQHVLWMQGQDETGTWGLPVGETFLVDAGTGGVVTDLELSPNPQNGATTYGAQLDAALLPPGATVGDGDTILTGVAQSSVPGTSVVAAQACLAINGGPIDNSTFDTCFSDHGLDVQVLGAGPSGSAGVVSLGGVVPRSYVGPPDGGLTDGDYPVYVRVQEQADAGGTPVWSAPVPVMLTVDKTGPDADGGATVDPTPNDGFQSNAGNLGFLDSFRVNGAFTDPAGIDAAEAFIGDQPIDADNGTGAALGPNDGGFGDASEHVHGFLPLSVIRSLPEGDVDVWLHARDTAGNWGAYQHAVLVYDKTPPSVSALRTGSGSSWNFTLTATDAVGPIAAAEYATATNQQCSNAQAAQGPAGCPTIAGTAYGTGTPIGLGANPGASVSLPVSVSGSFRMVAVRVQDAAGNWSGWVVPGRPPVVSSLSVNPTGTVFTFSATDSNQPAQDLVAAEYVATTDPCPDPASAASCLPATQAGSGTAFALPTGVSTVAGLAVSLPAAVTAVGVRVRSAGGLWSDLRAGKPAPDTTPPEVTSLQAFATGSLFNRQEHVRFTAQDGDSNVASYQWIVSGTCSLSTLAQGNFAQCFGNGGPTWGNSTSVLLGTPAPSVSVTDVAVGGANARRVVAVRVRDSAGNWSTPSYVREVLL